MNRNFNACFLVVALGCGGSAAQPDAQAVTARDAANPLDSANPRDAATTPADAADAVCQGGLIFTGATPDALTNTIISIVAHDTDLIIGYTTSAGGSVQHQTLELGTPVSGSWNPNETSARLTLIETTFGGNKFHFTGSTAAAVTITGDIAFANLHTLGGVEGPSAGVSHMDAKRLATAQLYFTSPVGTGSRTAAFDVLPECGSLTVTPTAAVNHFTFDAAGSGATSASYYVDDTYVGNSGPPSPFSFSYDAGASGAHKAVAVFTGLTPVASVSTWVSF